MIIKEKAISFNGRMCNDGPLLPWESPEVAPQETGKMLLVSLGVFRLLPLLAIGLGGSDGAFQSCAPIII